MGHSCSKSQDALDSPYQLQPQSLLQQHHHQPQSGFVLESDPRNRRRYGKANNSKKKTKDRERHSLPPTGAAAACHHGKGGGIYKWDPSLYALNQQSIELLQQSDGRPLIGQCHLLFKHQQQLQLQQQSQPSPPTTRTAAATTTTTVSSSSHQRLSSQKFSRFHQHRPSPTQQQQQQDRCRSVEEENVRKDDTSLRGMGSGGDGDSGGDSYNEATQKETLVTRLIVRRHQVRSMDEGISGTHIYAIRWPRYAPLQLCGSAVGFPEQAPARALVVNETTTTAVAAATNDPSSDPSLPVSLAMRSTPPSTTGALSTIAMPSSKPVTIYSSQRNLMFPLSVESMFMAGTMATLPRKPVRDWVPVAEQHNIYIADVGLSPDECDRIIQITEQACRGQYAAYTYAKQTLGCREFPSLAWAVQDAVHTVVHAILQRSANPRLSLDDREPHMVKYDVTKKERQKLDMHTDKSEWTFLIALSNGCGLDYEGGGTYFECLDSTVHVQRGHALIFPGKLRHCGQRISSGLRFLLVGFLVDKTVPICSPSSTAATTVAPTGAASTGSTTPVTGGTAMPSSPTAKNQDSVPSTISNNATSVSADATPTAVTASASGSSSTNTLHHVPTDLTLLGMHHS